MALFVNQGTKKLSIPETDDWVEIKTALTVGMRNRIFGASMKMRVANTGDAEIDALAFRTALLKEIIVGWSSTVPVTPGAVEDMVPEVADWIAEQFDTAQTVRDAEQIAFLGASSSASPTEPPGSPQSSPTSTKSPGSGTGT